MIKHKKVSSQPDGANPDLVNASDWNDAHDLTGLALSDVPGLEDALAAASGPLSPLASAEIQIAAAASLTIGRAHVCSGTAADYTVTLPAAAGNAGRYVSVRMAPSLTRWVTLQGAGAELIDGLNARNMWAHESATLLCDGAAWTKVAGRSVAIRTTMQRAAWDGAQSMPVAGWYHVTTPTVLADNTAALAVPAGYPAGGYIRVLRDSVYALKAFCGFSGVSATKNMAIGVVNQAASGVIGFTPREPGWIYLRPDESGALYGSAGIDRAASAGTMVGVTIFNGDTAARSTTSADSINPTVSLTELPLW